MIYSGVRSFKNKIWKVRESYSECFLESIARSRTECRELSYDAAELPEASLFAQELLEFAQKGFSIGIFGDYDADGITSVAIWIEFLRKIGIRHEVYVPDRADGYGASVQGIELLSSKTDGLLFLDCGSNSAELLDSLQMPVWILDHHQIQTLPSSAKVINPYRTDVVLDPKYREICTAGLSFMFVQSFASKFKLKEDFVESLADLACIGTVGDVMPLNFFNKICVKKGLELINAGSRQSIVSLCEVLGIGETVNQRIQANGGSSKSAFTQKSYNLINYSKVAFYLVPCINAAGRLMSAKLALDWLLSTFDSHKLSLTLNSLNLQRREMEKEILEEIRVDNSEDILFLKDERLHAGLVGIIAGRLKELHSKTSFVFYKSGENWKGSARSEGHDLGKLIAESVALGFAEAGGGHKAAAGITVANNKFEAWKEWILNQSNHEPIPEPSVEVDGFIPELGLNRLANLESFAPFGPGNPIPKLILKAAWLKDVIFSGEHARCILQSGRCIFAFRAANSWGIELKRRIGRHVDLLLSVDENSVKIEDAMESQ